MCCHPSEKPRQGAEGWLCWEASPGAQLISQSQVPASLSFWKRVLLLLLFLTISIPKLLNEACYSKSNQSLHGWLFLLPSLLTPLLVGSAAGWWAVIGGKSSPHLPKPFLLALSHAQGHKLLKEEVMLMHWSSRKHNLREGKKEHYFSRGVNTVTQFYFLGILTNLVLEEGKKYRSFSYQHF